jgi:uncharacterized RDD family membrane protein YckC
VATQRDESGPPATDTGVFAPPSVFRRFGALLLDWILCLLLSNFIGDPLRDGWPPVVVLIVEYALFIGLFAQTPGMYLMKIRCVSVSTGRPIGVPRAFLRGVLLCLVVPALIMDRHGRGLHDRAVGSVVAPAR